MRVLQSKYTGRVRGLGGAGREILLYFTIDGAIWGGPYADSIVIYNRWRDFCPSVRRLAGVGRDILLYFTIDGSIGGGQYANCPAGKVFSSSKMTT